MGKHGRWIPPHHLCNLALTVGLLCGLFHAFSSIAWAFGSDFLLDTVGEVAQEISALGARQAATMLFLISIFKLGSVFLLAGNSLWWFGTGRVSQLVTYFNLIEGVFLGVYGLASMIVSGLDIVALNSEGSDNSLVATAHWGHLLLWDPLFFLWGGALVTIALSRIPSITTKRETK